MAMSKALQAKRWREALDISTGIKCSVQPMWLSRDRQQAISKAKSTDDNQNVSHHAPTTTAIRFTLHAEGRMAQRNLSDEEIGRVILYGQVWHKAGAVIKHLRQKDIPAAVRADQRWQQLIGATVVMTKDERILITAYRNRNSGLRKIKRKPDYGWN